ncbi:hypothetical protein ACFLUQ_00005 [Chloroflexota bacterium]
MMEGKDTDKNTPHTSKDTAGQDDLQVRQRLRTLVELAITIGRRKGMFKSLPPLEEDNPDTGPAEETER